MENKVLEVVIEDNELGGFDAHVLNIENGCIATYGDTLEETYKHICDAIDGYLEVMIENGKRDLSKGTQIAIMNAAGIKETDL